MTSANRSLVTLVVLFLFTTTAAALIAFFVNYWGEFQLGGTYGLWQLCGGQYGPTLKCQWIYDSTYWSIPRDVPPWFLACQVMFSICVVCLTVNLLFFIPFYACNRKTGGSCFDCMGRLIYGSMILVLVVLTVALLTYALSLHLREERDFINGVSMERHLGWAYWLMVGAWAMCVATIGAIVTTHRRTYNVA